MRIVFAATGDIALPSFRRLLDGDNKPLVLVTQPDKPVGRKQTLTPPRIKEVAIEAGIEVLQPELIGDIAGELTKLRADVMVVMAYGQILRENILSLPGLEIINLHASLLPKYRGAACIQAAIDAGDSETGITSMHVVRALDAGDMILQKRIPIDPDDTGGTLHDKLADLAAEVLEETLTLIESGSAPRIPQNEEQVSYIAKLNRDDGRIDWSQPATAIERKIRAYAPWPGTYTMAEEGTRHSRLKIFPPTEVAARTIKPGSVEAHGEAMIIGCGDGTALIVNEVQPEGSKRMTGGAYLRGKDPSRML